MARLRKRHLPHRVNVTPLAGENAEGDHWGTKVQNVPAYVEQKSRLVVDRRSTSPTFGQEITARTFIVLLLVDEVLPRTLVEVWPGTARAREAEVIDSAYFEYRGAPSHVEVWTD